MSGREEYIGSSAITDIITERRRQVEMEGFDAAHDNAHDAGELACAGAAYALHAGCRLYPQDQVGFDEPPPFWMWEPAWWKPNTPRRDLVRAAALILAEIERGDRLGWPK